MHPLRLLAAALLAAPLMLSPVAGQEAPVAAAAGGTASAAQGIVGAARGQLGVTTIYDPAYVRLDFPGGDVPRDRGVCSDVVIRALREALGLDLQHAVNRDMGRAFSAYPALWGLTRPDRNIDHRRVPNLETLLTRVGAAVPAGTRPSDFLPGDIVTSRLPGNLPHVMIVSDRFAADGTPLVLHNIGAGAREENALFAYPLKAQFRLAPESLARLRALAPQDAAPPGPGGAAPAATPRPPSRGGPALHGR